ncbi:hypothetical protein FBZ83_10633 [Azospirillum brasilense]|uniref:YbhB/YbcL family Raf kinase inhibitor-like protein n=1 Tax=Azospirillum brasilense TaxID=192 RepID=A0A560CDB7_AZOBR|nr:YbhB/YbcL family Raf kinase inhibitor-like protein [Azospirillum brasilense]TWA82850.1 hypothetical protein FBZ83_10633 [Azospirillum brasilense]
MPFTRPNARPEPLWAPLLAAALTLGAVTATAQAQSQPQAKPFALTLPGHADGRFQAKNSLPAAYGFGCDGTNLSPEIRWDNAPEGTRSFVLTIHDADAPTGIGWTHWVVANIPADARVIPEGASGKADRLPAGALESRTDFGAPGFGGPCPPQGTEHRYTVTLTALGLPTLPAMVTADSMPALVGFLSKANALGEAKTVLLYGR